MFWYETYSLLSVIETIPAYLCMNADTIILCSDAAYWWLCVLSIRSLALRNSPLLSDFPILTCPNILRYSAIGTRAGRFSEFGFGSSSKLFILKKWKLVTEILSWCCDQEVEFLYFYGLNGGRIFVFCDQSSPDFMSLCFVFEKLDRGSYCKGRRAAGLRYCQRYRGILCKTNGYALIACYWVTLDTNGLDSVRLVRSQPTDTRGLSVRCRLVSRGSCWSPDGAHCTATQQEE